MDPSVTWKTHRTGGFVLVGSCKGPSNVINNDKVGKDIKVAAIDLNLTLIVSKSGELHGRDDMDWRWWHEGVPDRIRDLVRQNYTVIITSNQGRLTELDGSEAPEAIPFKRKMGYVMRDLQVPVTLFVACANDIYRKPRPGLWTIIPELTGNEGCSIDKKHSMVIGDAAGRPSDFSDSDVHWAMNAGIQFYTPEAFFLGEEPAVTGHKFDPKWHLNNNEVAKCGLDITQLLSKSLVILVGLPGAGKTTFYHHYLQSYGFVRKNADSHHTRESLINEVDELMARETTVVIDDLNIDVQSREMSQEHRPIYPRLRFLDLVPRFQKPTIDEGFQVIHEVEFKWHGTEAQLAIWRQFWL